MKKINYNSRMKFFKMYLGTLADPGFSEGGVSSPEVGAQPNIWQTLYQKLRENERNWTEIGRASLAPWFCQCSPQSSINVNVNN